MASDLFHLLDRACAHWMQARFGPYGPRARAGLYCKAAELFEALVELLREQAATELEMAEAEAMVRRACGQRS